MIFDYFGIEIIIFYNCYNLKFIARAEFYPEPLGEGDSAEEAFKNAIFNIKQLEQKYGNFLD